MEIMRLNEAQLVSSCEHQYVLHRPTSEVSSVVNSLTDLN
jgi:hypothetical protein